MAFVPENKKYLTLEDVRVSYSAKDDSVHLTAKDPDVREKGGFHIPLYSGTGVEAKLREMLVDNGLIDVQREFDDGRTLSEDPTKVKLGFSVESGRIYWEMDSAGTSNLVIAGTKGSMSAVLVDSVIRHLREHRVDVSAIDLTGIELTPHASDSEDSPRRSDDAGMLFAVDTSRDAAFGTISGLRQILKSRESFCEEVGVNSYRDLPIEIGKRILLINEWEDLRRLLEEDSGEARMASDELREIFNLGSALGFHVIVHTTHGADAVESLREFLWGTEQGAPRKRRNLWSHCLRVAAGLRDDRLLDAVSNEGEGHEYGSPNFDRLKFFAVRTGFSTVFNGYPPVGR